MDRRATVSRRAAARLFRRLVSLELDDHEMAVGIEGGHIQSVPLVVDARRRPRDQGVVG
jgi:hypothetical protein